MSVDYTHITGKLSFEVKTSHFLINTDVTTDLGGDDTAPDPHKYLEVSLASCTAITVMMYAKRKGIPLEDIDVSIKITSEGEANALSREIRFIGHLTAEQKQSLMVIADKCPIHKFLSRGCVISSTMKE